MTEQSFLASRVVALLLSACLAWSSVALSAESQKPPEQAASSATERPDASFIAEQQARYQRWAAAQPQGSGPYGTVREEVAALPDSTIFRPVRMDAAGKLPIVAFANGACLNTPIEFAAFLAEIVSQGYFVVAAGRVGRKFDGEDLSKVVEGHPGQIVTRKLLVDAVDWAIRENERSGSPYRHRLDTQQVAYMGQSCGGMQALSASTDRRTTTTIVLNSGRFAPGMQVPGRGKFPEYFEWSQLHAPIAFFIGGENDLGIGRDNFKEIQHLPVFLADLPVDHSGAYPGPDMRWVKAVLGWLDWQLRGSERGKRLFVGERCGLCVDPDWTVGGQKRLQ